jgi:hypothetical protein
VKVFSYYSLVAYLYSRQEAKGRKKLFIGFFTKKKLVIKALDQIQKKYEIEMPVMINIDVYTDIELADVEGTTVKESHELWGDYVIALLYSDHPDYCFINEGDDILKVIESWMREIKLISL